MAEKRKHGKADENFIYDEDAIGFLSTGIHLSYVQAFKSLAKRFKSLRKGLAPSRARLDERWIENSLVLRALPPPPARILDVGGATSPLPLTLAMLGYDITTADLRPYTLGHPNLRTVQGDIRTVPLAPPYDAVYSISVVEHAGIARYSDKDDDSTSRGLVIKMADLAKGPILITVPFGQAHEPKRGEKSAQSGRPTGFRIFDRAMIQDLARGLKLDEFRTFGLTNGTWRPMKPEEVEQIPLRRYATGVAFLRLLKP